MVNQKIKKIDQPSLARSDSTETVRQDSSECLPQATVVEEFFRHYWEQQPLRKDFHHMPLLNHSEMVDEILELLFKGDKACWNIFSKSLEYLIENPDLFEKLELEIDEAFEKGLVFEKSSLSQLMYLDAIVKETIRLNDTVKYLVRKTIQPVVLMGYTFPKNVLGLI